MIRILGQFGKPATHMQKCVPIVYFCAGLPPGAKFNLMLARSGVKVCTSYAELEDYLDRCFEAETLLFEPYSDAIE